MAYALQIHSDKRVYPIPNGLYDLMSDITREVLRNQPNDVISHIVDYIEAQINTKVLSQIALKEVEGILGGHDSCISLCANLGVSLATANRAAAIIQAAYLGYVTRKKLIEKMLNPEVASLHIITTDKFLEAHKISFLQATDAASRIQAMWRGYSVRKRLTTEKEQAIATYGFARESWNHDWLWKEFEMEPKSKEVIFQKNIFLPKRGMEKSKYLPRRNITIDHHKLKTLFRGDKEDYDLMGQSILSETPSLSVINNQEINQSSEENNSQSIVNLLPYEESSKMTLASASESSEATEERWEDRELAQITSDVKLQLKSKKLRQASSTNTIQVPSQEKFQEQDDRTSFGGEPSLRSETHSAVDLPKGVGIEIEEQSVQAEDEDSSEEDNSESIP